MILINNFNLCTTFTFLSKLKLTNGYYLLIFSLKNPAGFYLLALHRPSLKCQVVAGRAVVFRPAQPYQEKDVAAAVVCGLWALGRSSDHSPARTGGGGGFTPLKKVVACTIFVRAKALILDG